MAIIRVDPALLQAAYLTSPIGFEHAEARDTLPDPLRIGVRVPGAGIWWAIVEHSAVIQYLGLTEPPTWGDYNGVSDVMDRALSGKIRRGEFDNDLDAKSGRPRFVLRAADFSHHKC